MERIKIGTIVNAVGLKGEVKIYNYSDYKERFEELPSILVAEKKATDRLISKVSDIRKTW